MSPPKLQLRGPQAARLSEHYQKPLGRILVDMGYLEPERLLHALAIHNQCQSPLEQVLLAEGFSTPDQILTAQSAQWAAIRLTFDESPPDPACASALDPLLCLKHGVMPWLRLGNTLVIATCHPERFEELLGLLPGSIGPVVMGLASETDIQQAVAETHATKLAHLAETTLPEEDSCRNMRRVANLSDIRRFAAIALLGAGIVVLWPLLFYTTVAAWAVFTLVCLTFVKLVACVARLRGDRPSGRGSPSRSARSPPKVSILVPLFREKAIAARLVTRLSRLNYPKSRLQVLLLLESEDDQTRTALQQADLPPWMRVLVVPPGELTTKPRALNYGLRFCVGEIVGIYDAEDNPDPNQIGLVTARFERSPARSGLPARNSGLL